MDGVTNSSALSASVKSRTRIAAPTLSILQKNKKNQLTWNEVPNVQVYRIFRATSKNGPYTAIATVSGTSYWDKNLDISKKYYYKVRGISQVGNKSYYGIYSSVKSTKKVLKPVVMLTETYGRKVYITWAKVKYSDGIVVYRADGASGGSYKKVATYEDGRTKFVSKKRKKGKTFRFKVRSFRIIDGKRVYGACSAVQKVTIK